VAPNELALEAGERDRLLAVAGEQTGPMTEGCVFCDHDRLREADLCFENDFCIYSSTRDPRDPPDVIPGCGAIVPKLTGPLRST
jgi:hypothetical protein